MANDSWAYRFGRGIRETPSAIDEHAKRLREQAQGVKRGFREAEFDFLSGATGLENPFDESVPRGTGPLRVPTIEEAAEQWRPPGAQPAPWQTPAPAPRKTVPSIDEAAREMDDLDRREAEYSADPDAWERRRQAAPGVSGELRYSIGGGPERSYNVGANRTDVKGDPDFARFRDDKAFGQDIAPRKGGGSVSMMNGLDDPMKDPNYRNYLANAGRLDEAMAEQADISRNTALAQNPFAQEEAAIDRAIRMQDAQARNAGMKQQYTQQAKLDALRELDAIEMMKRIEIERDATPEEKAEALARLAEWRSRQEVALGLRDRMDATL